MKATLLILAAGMGSRYGSLKQIDQFGPSGETIIDYSIYDAIEAGFDKLVFVIRKNIEEEFKEVFVDKFQDRIEIDYAFQELDIVPKGINVPKERVKPWGTGHALMVAREKINTPFAVINADDFYGKESFKVMADLLRELDPNSIDTQCMVGFRLGNTLSENGYVSRGICQVHENSMLEAVVEHTKVGYGADKTSIFSTENAPEPIQLASDAVASMNLFGFTPRIFEHVERYFRQFIAERYTELKSEFYLPSIVNNLIEENLSQIKVLDTPEKWFGVTYPEDKKIAQHKLSELVGQGIYPNNLWATVPQ
ncbi:sugar phosphate nucleotidyltransferase [Limibacter armeniacum]|uniref:nucleotidyltransferase family protein n=1 Tax=Limibacter armeniacum TaxID=466084 RepID=UPI002FE5ACD7